MVIYGQQMAYDLTRSRRKVFVTTSREELDTVFGMATYLGKFAPNLSDVTAPLRDLTKKENDFIWDAGREEAYNSMKQLLCKEPGPVLAYFDPQKDVLLQCDGSQKGLVIKGHIIVTPFEQREEILQQLHIGHFGIEKTKQRARDDVYWPLLNTDIELLIARCSICQEHQWAPQKEPMLNRPIPTRPFQMVAVDRFECDDTTYLSL